MTSGEKSSSTASLAGIRVLDMSRVLAGPWAGQTLGDLGAEVIKIERPGAGDDTRSWGPPYLKDETGEETSEAAYYLCANRNKKSVTVDINCAKGQEIVRQLAAKSDVLIENFKVGGLKRYGLDYDGLHRINPRLIYCSITGFGQTGPYSHRAGYDFLIQAMGGMMSITGRGDTEAGAGPQKVGVAITDIVTGLYATVGILAALRHREATGEGQHVDMALLDAQIASLANQNMNYLTTGVAPVRLGNSHPNIVPYQDFPTADGGMVIAVGNDSQFANLCTVLLHPEWAKDVRFTNNRARVANRDVLIPLMRAATAAKPTTAWVAALERVGVPCGPVNTLSDVFDDPQVKARGLKIALPHPLSGQVALVGNPMRLSESPVQYRVAPPVLGQHTAEVLGGLLDMPETQLAELAAQGVI